MLRIKQNNNLIFYCRVSSVFLLTLRALIKPSFASLYCIKTRQIPHSVPFIYSLIRIKSNTLLILTGSRYV